MKIIKRCFLILGILLGVVLLAASGLFLMLVITEFRPEPVEQVEVVGAAPTLDRSTFTILSWNIGYCALGEESDFFMDGGRQVQPETEDWVDKNLAGIQACLAARETDFVLFQEVDTDSQRSFHLNEAETLREKESLASTFALNISCKFVPYPWPPIGKVNSGLLTTSRYAVSEASRISLPCPFSWPVSIANFKRCLLVTRVPIADSEKELVLVNLHLEGYDVDDGKIEQSKQLRAFLSEEYEKGNYVVAGGDWNQVFPGAEKNWPNTHGELWSPGYLDADELDQGWSYVWDDTVPTCRLLNQPYKPSDTEGTQYYVIDGFLISPNLRMEDVETVDAGFSCSDHNPVVLTLTLGD
ncbi:MAG: endonuclease [Oscillospiraceae bacterium]|nr:endonuclease [Oscillospiraceae bacterium]